MNLLFELQKNNLRIKKVINWRNYYKILKKWINLRNKDGGGKRIRTADPPLAKRMLYQLSYTPVNFNFDCNLKIWLTICSYEWQKMVGLSRLERLTSPLSAGCSNHLSYRPDIIDFNNTELYKQKMTLARLKLYFWDIFK